jgi:uncharacterized protein (TIGR02270 family)
MPLIAEVHEHYLHEAELLFESWDVALDSPAFVLDELLEGPEQRLVAQLDGLIVGGPAIVDTLLLPLLADEPEDDEHRTRAAALTILLSGSLAACEQVLALLEHPEPLVWRATVRALGLAQREGLTSWLARDLGQCEGGSLAGRLAVLAERRVDLGRWVLQALASDDPRVCAAAARLARTANDLDVVRGVVPLLHSSDPATRREAMLSALLRGISGTWSLVHERARDDSDPLHETCRRWLAMVGDAATQAWLIADARRCPSAASLTCAALTGRVAAAELALELLDHAELARIAGEALGIVAGLPSDDESLWLDEGATGRLGASEDEALPALDEDDLDAELVPAAELWLRLPSPSTVRAWWSEQRSLLHPHIRYREGRPIAGHLVRACLFESPMRRRHALAEELLLRSGGRIELDTRTWARLQRAKVLASPLETIDHQRAPWH